MTVLFHAAFCLFLSLLSLALYFVKFYCAKSIQIFFNSFQSMKVQCLTSDSLTDLPLQLQKKKNHSPVPKGTMTFLTAIPLPIHFHLPNACFILIFQGSAQLKQDTRIIQASLVRIHSSLQYTPWPHRSLCHIYCNTALQLVAASVSTSGMCAP